MRPYTTAGRVTPAIRFTYWLVRQARLSHVLLVRVGSLVTELLQWRGWPGRKSPESSARYLTKRPGRADDAAKMMKRR